MPKVTDKYIDLQLHDLNSEEEAAKVLQGKNTSKRFKYAIYVDSNGEFSTTLPAEMITFLESRGMTGFKSNRLGNKGYYTGKTIDAIVEQVGNIAKKYHSYEVVEEKVQIEYFIEIACSYVKDAEGNIHPNGSGVPDYKWIEGTTTRNATQNGPSGYTFYAKPVDYKRVRYCDGSEKEMRSRHSESTKDDEHMKFLVAVISAPSEHSWGSRGKLQYIDYTPEAGKFFGDMYRSIFRLNEGIKDLLNPEGIQRIIDSGIKLIDK